MHGWDLEHSIYHGNVCMHALIKLNPITNFKLRMKTIELLEVVLDT